MYTLNVRKCLKNLTTNDGDLSQRAVKSTFWVFSLRVIQQFFSMARLVVLARILAPHDFGLMGIALLALAALETLSQTGFQQALIQKKNDIKSYLNTAWTILVIRGIILFCVLYLIAPYAADFFDAPEAKPIIQVIGLSIIFQAFTNIGVIYFQKELEFNKQFIYQLSGTIADFSVAVISAFLLGNVWALVYGILAGNVVLFILSYLIHPYRPHFNFDLEKAKELFTFGKWVFGSSILVFLITQGDDVFVGKVLAVSALGFYQMAYRISNLPATEITHVISQVTFPLYSKVHDNAEKLREAYIKVFQITTFLSFPIAGLILILSHDFTQIFLGDKWMPMVPTMQMLALAGLARSIAATSGYLFYAIGKAKTDTKLQIIRFLTLAILIYPLTIKWGIFGTAIAVFFSNFISNVGFSLLALQITNCNSKKYVSLLLTPLISTLIMILLMFELKGVISIGLLEFILLTSIGILSYGILIYLSDRWFNYNIKGLLSHSFKLLTGV